MASLMETKGIVLSSLRRSPAFQAVPVVTAMSGYCRLQQRATE
jgi:hypothetical protein